MLCNKNIAQTSAGSLKLLCLIFHVRKVRLLSRSVCHILLSLINSTNEYTLYTRGRWTAEQGH